MIDKKFKRRPLRHGRHHLLKMLFRGWPWIIWLSVALAVVLLLPGGLNRVQFHGVAERTYEYVSPLENGRLKVLMVDMGEQVHAGQLLGELDNASKSTDMLMDQASLMKTRDKIYSIQYDLEKLKLEEAQTASALQILVSRWQRTHNLMEKNLLLEQNSEDLRPQIQTTKKMLTLYPALTASLEKRLASAQTNIETFNSDNLKQLLKEQCQLKAITSGIVAEILHQPGDVIKTGEPVSQATCIYRIQ
jgi:multidrug resistance efflux pump